MIDREEKQDHLVDKHKFDDVADLWLADDATLERDHNDAHRYGQLVWEPHKHPEGGWA